MVKVKKTSVREPMEKKAQTSRNVWYVDTGIERRNAAPKVVDEFRQKPSEDDPIVFSTGNEESDAYRDAKVNYHARLDASKPMTVLEDVYRKEIQENDVVADLTRQLRELDVEFPKTNFSDLLERWVESDVKNENILDLASAENGAILPTELKTALRAFIRKELLEALRD